MQIEIHATQLPGAVAQALNDLMATAVSMSPCNDGAGPTSCSASYPATLLDAALGSGALIGRLGLTDAAGNPLCAAVRPPLIEWSAGPRR